MVMIDTVSLGSGAAARLVQVSTLRKLSRGVLSWENCAAPISSVSQVMVGVSGGEYGIRGYVAAYDATSGDQTWRTYTVPAPGEPGSDTWPPWSGRSRRRSVSTVWARPSRR